MTGKERRVSEVRVAGPKRTTYRAIGMTISPVCLAYLPLPSLPPIKATDTEPDRRRHFRHQKNRRLRSLFCGIKDERDGGTFPTADEVRGQGIQPFQQPSATGCMAYRVSLIRRPSAIDHGAKWHHTGASRLDFSRLLSLPLSLSLY